MPSFPLHFNEDNLGNSRITFTRTRALPDRSQRRGTAANVLAYDTGTRRRLVADGDSITMYVPQGLVFPDGASYSNTDLGLVGAASAALARGTAGEDLAVTVQNITSEDVRSILARGLVTSGASLVGNAIGQIFGSGTPGAAIGGLSVQNGINYGVGRIFNPNTKSLFQGVNIRGFTFQFQMIPQSKEEADEVASIVKAFRAGIYPERTTDSITVKYPPKWIIRIDPGPDRTDSQHVIKFKPAFLINANTSYNPGSQMYHSGGAPVETTITISFSEAETLDQQDIADGF